MILQIYRRQKAFLDCKIHKDTDVKKENKTGNEHE